MNDIFISGWWHPGRASGITVPESFRDASDYVRIGFIGFTRVGKSSINHFLNHFTFSTEHHRTFSEQHRHSRGTVSLTIPYHYYHHCSDHRHHHHHHQLSIFVTLYILVLEIPSLLICTLLIFRPTPW